MMTVTMRIWITAFCENDENYNDGNENYDELAKVVCSYPLDFTSSGNES